MSEHSDPFDKLLFGFYDRYKMNQNQKTYSGVWKCKLCPQRFWNVSEEKMDFVLRFHLNEFHKTEMEKKLRER